MEANYNIFESETLYLIDKSKLQKSHSFQQQQTFFMKELLESQAEHKEPSTGDKLDRDKLFS